MLKLMKKPILIIFLLFTVLLTQAQHKNIDSLRTALSKAETDTVKMNVLIELGKQYFLFNPDSSIIVAQQAYAIAVKNNRQYDISRILNIMANAYATMGDYAKGMQYYLQARRQFEALHDVHGVVMENNNI